MSKVNPVRPEEVAVLKQEVLPSDVIKAFNELIAEKYAGGCCVIKMKDAIARIHHYLDVSRDEIFAKGYLDIEELYGKYGWKVTFDKPAYNENYDAYYTFEKAK